MEMFPKLVILALSFMIISAFPVHRNTREATWTDPRANQANDKAGMTKDVDITYKSHIDSSSLYIQDDQNKNPVVEEMQQKLNMESERLRARLRQELSELRERLSPSPSQLDSTLASMRERLAPLTQQLQSSLSSNTQELCGQLSLYLQGLETAEVQADEASPGLYQQASQWISQTLELSSSKVADIIGDFQTQTNRMVEHLKEKNLELWQEMSSRLGQEVDSLRKEAQTRVGTLKTDFVALLDTSNSNNSEKTASIALFCQNANLLSEVFQARMEKLFQGLEENLQVQGASSFSSSPSLSDSSLQEDFSVKFSALIEDILHSV